METDFQQQVFITLTTYNVIGLVIFLAVYLVTQWVRGHLGKAPPNQRPAGWQLTYIADPVSIGAAAVAVASALGLTALLSPLEMASPPIPVNDVRQAPVQPVWNLWAERTMRLPARTDPLPPAFAPTTLAPLQDYTVVINLAAMKYASEQIGPVFSKDVSSTFAEWLDQNPDVNGADLTMVALADPDYFTFLDGNVKNFRVDLAKIRAAKRDGVVVPASPFDHLRDHNGEAPFSFGLQSFVVHTGERAGNGTIAISVWADGKPVDELTLTLCIVGAAADLPCRGSLSVSNPLAGVDLTMRGVYPDLALHMIDAKKSVMGVLRCNSCGWAENDYRRWNLEETADWVADRIKDITAAIGAVASADTPLDQARPAIENAGDDLYNVMFHARKPNHEAMAAFAALMTRAQAAEKIGAPPPSLFVRILPDRPTLTLAPIGLMRARPEEGPADFVGFVANVQTPLEYQNYSEMSNCLSQWVLFVPPEKPKGGFKAVQKARGEFEGWIGAFRKTCPGCVIEEENAFHKWLNQVAPREPRAVAILSHHAANALYFNEFSRSPQVLSSAVRRRFANPSFVLLNACGTSEPGASEFIRQFNRNGVNSAIATSTLVDPVLAGKFLTEFMDQLKRNVNDQGYAVSRARFDAVRSLGRNAKSVYGPKALAFILAGNGAIRLCVPDP